MNSVQVLPEPHQQVKIIRGFPPKERTWVQVRISHCLANWVRAEDRTSLWFSTVPECVPQVLVSELIVDPTD
jgi:hypothetical protein